MGKDRDEKFESARNWAIRMGIAFVVYEIMSAYFESRYKGFFGWLNILDEPGKANLTAWLTSISCLALYVCIGGFCISALAWLVEKMSGRRDVAQDAEGGPVPPNIPPENGGIPPKIPS